MLRGARETIQRGGDRLALFVELHPSIWPLSGETRADFELELDCQGPRTWRRSHPTRIRGQSRECVVRLVRR